MSTKKTGFLLCLVGYFGSGKSTFIDGFVKHLSGQEKEIVKIYTTRPPRTQIENLGLSKEYIFVTKDEYLSIKRRARNWSERTDGDYFYALDVDAIIKKVEVGTICLTTMLPHRQTIILHKQLFNCRNFFVFIDVDKKTCSTRLLRRGMESLERTRLQTTLSFKECLDQADVIFHPSCNLEKDILNFNKLIANLTGT